MHGATRRKIGVMVDFLVIDILTISITIWIDGYIHLPNS